MLRIKRTAHVKVGMNAAHAQTDKSGRPLTTTSFRARWDREGKEFQSISPER